MVAEGAFDPQVPVFRFLGQTAEQRDWLRTLPALVRELESRWRVRTGPPYLSGSSSWAAPGRTADGEAVVGEGGMAAPGGARRSDRPAVVGRSRRTVLVHGDANPTNVLSATREPWQVIDAKPMVGDPGYDPAPLVTRLGAPFQAPGPVGLPRRRLAAVAEITAEPAERLVGWAVARAVESALWHVSRAELADTTEEMAGAAILAGLLDA